MTENEEYTIIRDILEEESLYFSFLHMKNNHKWGISKFLSECRRLFEEKYVILYQYEGVRVVDIEVNKLEGVESEEHLKGFYFYAEKLAVERYNQLWPKFQKT